MKIYSQQELFDKAKKFDNASTSFIIASTVLTLSSILVDKFYPELSLFSITLNTINCLSIIAYVIVDWLFQWNNIKGNIQKRLNFVDNSFETNFSGTKLKDYFSNDNLKAGIYKLAVNSYENCLFTFEISRRMQKKNWIFTTFILAIFVLSACYGEQYIIFILIQLSLPVLLIQKSIRLSIFVFHVETILKNFQSLFSGLLTGDEIEKKSGEILRNIIDYEAIISWGSIPLDSKIYDTINPELSSYWENCKKDYKIKTSES